MTTGAFRTRAPRQQVRMSLIFDRGDRYIAANLLDISESGMLLAGDESAPIGKQVTLYADLNDNQSWPIHIDGLVVRQGQPAEEGHIAVRFLYVSVAQLAQMRLFVQALREAPPPEVAAPALAAAAKSHAAPATDAERRAEEPSAQSPAAEAPPAPLASVGAAESLAAEAPPAPLASVGAAESLAAEAPPAPLASVGADSLAAAAEAPPAPLASVGAADSLAAEAPPAPLASVGAAESSAQEPWANARAAESLAAAAAENGLPTGERRSGEGSAAAPPVAPAANASPAAAGWSTLTVDPALPAPFSPLEMADALGNLGPMDPHALSAPPPSPRDTRDIIATTVPGAHTQRAARVPLEDVCGILDLEDRFGVGYVIDLSETGFFLATDEELEEGIELRFIPDGPDDSVLPFELTARVVRTQDMCIERPRGVACQFDVTAAARQSLRQFVATKLATRPAS